MNLRWEGLSEEETRVHDLTEGHWRQKDGKNLAVQEGHSQWEVAVIHKTCPFIYERLSYPLCWVPMGKAVNRNWTWRKTGRETHVVSPYKWLLLSNLNKPLSLGHHRNYRMKISHPISGLEETLGVTFVPSFDLCGNSLCRLLGRTH